MSASNIKYRLTLAFILTIFITSGCGLLPFGDGSGGSDFETGHTEVVLTDTQIPTVGEPPAQTTEPTETPLPSATLSPTIRPTGTPFPTRTLRPSWTPSPTLSPTATKEIGWIIRDDFSVDQDQWYKASGKNWAMGFAQGGYFMSVTGNNVEITSSKSWLKLDDTRVIVDVFRESGKGYWGISCRETHAGSYYTIFITSEGEYGYGETRNTRVYLTFLGKSDKIFTGIKKVNHMMAECRGNRLTLYVNDAFIFSHEVEGIGPGWVGMMAGTTYEQDKVTVIFDNIEIWGPIEDESD
jgi:hypothetical protein